MIATLATGGKLAALLVTLSCQPDATAPGYDRCAEQVEHSWVAPSPSELKYCADSASAYRAKGVKSWCELLPADDLGIEPSAARELPSALTF